MSRHANEVVLSAYLDEQLSPEELRRVEDHLESCASCRELLVSMRRVVGSLRSLERQAPSPLLGPGIVRRIRIEGRPKGSVERIEARLERIHLESPTLVMFALVVAFALLLVVFAHGMERFAHRTRVVVSPGLEELMVGGHRLHRVDGCWIEVGYERSEARVVEIRSEAGRQLLERLPAIEALLADGPVILKDEEQGLLELRSELDQSP